MAKVKLSPSRVKTLQGCGILYWNTYKLPNPLPRGRNSGSSRSSTVHYVLECLIRPDRRERVEKMIQFNDPWIDPATKRLAQIHADKLDVGDRENSCIIRIVPSLSGNDNYHTMHGYIGAKQRAQGFVWDKNDGLDVIIYSKSQN